MAFSVNKDMRYEKKKKHNNTKRKKKSECLQSDAGISQSKRECKDSSHSPVSGCKWINISDSEVIG